MLIGKRIFITGGAGFLGSNLVKRYYGQNQITVFSRDESKHYYLKKQFPDIKCIIGDVRNYDLLKRSCAGHDIGIFAASLKQIDAVSENPSEAVNIIINGAINSRRAAEENGLEAACFISSDKSRAATTLYGSMKFVAGESFIVNSDDSACRLSCAIYGNVLNSTGSIIPLIWDSIKNNYALTLYSDKMTRFMIDIDEAMALVETSLQHKGVNSIPYLCSFLVKDMFDIFSEKFGLKYTVGKPRISEKIHEMMISKEEAPRVFYDNGNYFMHYKKTFEPVLEFKSGNFSSADTVVSKGELEQLLLKNNFFNPNGTKKY